MQIKTITKWDKIREFINIWLRDSRVYCGNCDVDYYKENFPCCNNPELGTNITFTKSIIDAIKDLRKEQHNVYASNKKKSFRTTIKLPKRLYFDLDKFHQEMWGTRLFDKKEELNIFMRKFPQFTVPERV